LKLKCDETLSNSAFKFNLRRYVKAQLRRVEEAKEAGQSEVRWCRLTPFKTTLKTPGTKRLKPEYEELISNFAFKFNLRRYTEAGESEVGRAELQADHAEWKAGRCGLTPGRP
jgi:hypothetical protein